VNDLICCVGSNPLPVVVSALTRRPAKLHLVLTEQVQEFSGRIWDLVERKSKEQAAQGLGRPVQRGEPLVLRDSDTGNIEYLRAVLKQSKLPWATADLDYTGGTKLMAAEIRAWWREQNREGVSSYLTERGKLILGYVGTSGKPELDTDLTLSFDDLSKLHFQLPLTYADRHKDSAILEIAERILDIVKEEGFDGWQSRLPAFRPKVLTFEIFQYEQQPVGLYYFGREAPVYSSDSNEISLQRSKPPAALKYRDEDAFLKDLSDKNPLLGTWDPTSLSGVVDNCQSFDRVVNALGTSGSKKERRAEAFKWLEGEWLEIVFARLLEQTGLFDEVRQDIKRAGDAEHGDKFQVDVVAVKGYRSYVFSCTTSARLAKHKLFEATHRAARIGGEYSRAAVVLRADTSANVLQAVREDGWQGYDQYRAFGLPHLKGEKAATSIGVEGEEGPPETLLEALQRWIKG